MSVVKCATVELGPLEYNRMIDTVQLKTLPGSMFSR